MNRRRPVRARDGMAILKTWLVWMLLPPGLAATVDGAQVVAAHQTMAAAATSPSNDAVS